MKKKTKRYPAGSRSAAPGSDNKKARSYPKATPTAAHLADNIVFCVNGVAELDGFIQRRSGELEDKISQTERRLGNFHTKSVRGHEYWYVWNDTGYEYVGKEDPRPNLQEHIKKIEAEMAVMKKNLETAMVAKIGPHAILDMKVIGCFSRNADCIPVNKIVKAAGGKLR